MPTLEELNLWNLLKFKNLIAMSDKRAKDTNFKIILTNRGKYLKSMGIFKKSEDAYKRFNELKKESDSVQFPIMTNNEEHHFMEANYEIVLLKALTEDEVKEATQNKGVQSQIRDEFGKFIDCTIKSVVWKVHDIAPYSVEESFFVFGHHPRFDRKTYKWIFDNILCRKLDDRISMKTIYIQNHRVLFDYDGGMDIVICKTKKDSLRLYNKLLDDCTNKDTR